MKLWLSGNQRPKNCNSLFALLKQKGLLTENRIWQRVTLAMKGGRTSLSRSLTKKSKYKSLVNLWIKLRRNPSKYLNHKLLRKNTAKSRQLIVYGIKRLARKDTKKARKAWQKAQKKYSFSIKDKGDVESYIGTKEALDHSPYALQKLSMIPANLRSEDAKLWMARMAIRQGDWGKLFNAIQSMPYKLKKKDIWQYWQSRAEARTGKRNSINLHALAKNASFYGFLTADHLGLPYSRLSQKEPNWEKDIPRIKNIASIKRATELFRIGLPKLAKKEWLWSLKRLSKQDKLVAAAYAHQINQPFMAIITVSQTKDWNQTGLRFPLNYKSLVQRASKQQGIDPAWAYGIMRRESAFDPIIISSAKAQGLMQILPSTARSVARSLGIKGHRTAHLLIPEKNARIGTAYLSQMLKKFNGNHILATASYNAGPHRMPKWRPDFPIDAARWIESIPYNETRSYVRAVMSYTTIYDYKLNKNKSRRITQRLQKVGPEQK